jgi:teichuronic acid biosynthesis glycosyltransferase TuaG
MKQKTLSVIVPFYNELSLIGDAVASVFNQTIISEFNFEILIINDGDYENKIIFDYLPEYVNEAVKIIANEEIHGAGGARNKGIEACFGEYVAFLDADDYWVSDKLELQMPLFENDCTFAATGYTFDLTNGSGIDAPRVIRSKLELLKNTNVGTSTVIIDRAFLGESRFSNREFSQDTELWAKLADKPNFRYGAVARVMTVYRPSERTKNKAKQGLHFWNLCRDLELGVFDLVDVMVKYSVNGFRRHFVNFIKRG